MSQLAHLGTVITIYVQATIQSTSNNFIDAFGGHLPLPVPSLGSAECFDTNPARFDTDVATSVCTRRAEALSSGCADVYSMAPFVQNLFVGKTPDALPDENDADSYTAVTLVGPTSPHRRFDS